MATVPSVPADESSGNTWTAAKVNVIYDFLALMVDPPRFYDLHTITVADATETTVALSNHTGTGLGTGNDAASYRVELTPSATNDNVAVDTGASGIYLVGAQLEFPFDADGIRYCRIQKNASNANEIEHRWSAATANFHIFTMSGLMELAATDTVRWRVYQSSGATMTANVGVTTWMHWLSKVPT